jgi:hypothetical protein
MPAATATYTVTRPDFRVELEHKSPHWNVTLWNLATTPIRIDYKHLVQPQEAFTLQFRARRFKNATFRLQQTTRLQRGWSYTVEYFGPVLHISLQSAPDRSISLTVADASYPMTRLSPPAPAPAPAPASAPAPTGPPAICSIPEDASPAPEPEPAALSPKAAALAAFERTLRDRVATLLPADTPADIVETAIRQEVTKFAATLFPPAPEPAPAEEEEDDYSFDPDEYSDEDARGHYRGILQQIYFHHRPLLIDILKTQFSSREQIMDFLRAVAYI